MQRSKILYAFSLILVTLLSACNLTSQAPTAVTPLDVPTIQASGKPVVIITSPQASSEVTVNTPVLVSASATDSVGVTRVQLLANGQIVQTRSSEAASGQTTLQAVLDYTPRQQGNVTLQVIAFRGAIASDPAQVDIVVRATQAQVTATINLSNNNGSSSVPVIDPNDPTCRALTNTGLNVRRGPGTGYDKITVLAAGTVVPIVGRVGDNSWWQVNSGFNVGWVSAEFTSVYGICNAVPIVAAPATATSNVPTTAPTFTPQPTFTPKPPPAATATPGKADLVVASIGGSTTVTLPSGAVSYSVTITNTGAGPSGAFANKVSVSDGTEKDLGVVSNLNAGESISLTFELTFTAAGSYNITATADSNSQVAEIYEVNNTSILSVKVT